MGTRHLICVYYKKRFYIAQYGAWDGDPDVQGKFIFEFLHEYYLINELRGKLTEEDKRKIEPRPEGVDDESHSEMSGDEIAEDGGRTFLGEEECPGISEDDRQPFQMSEDESTLVGSGDEQHSEMSGDESTAAGDDDEDDEQHSEISRGDSDQSEKLTDIEKLQGTAKALWVAFRSNPSQNMCLGEVIVKEFLRPSRHHETGAGILMLAIAAERLEDLKIKYYWDSACVCEWAYIIDLDHDTLEVFNSLDWDRTLNSVSSMTFTEVQAMNTQQFLNWIYKGQPLGLSPLVTLILGAVVCGCAFISGARASQLLTILVLTLNAHQLFASIRVPSVLSIEYCWEFLQPRDGMLWVPPADSVNRTISIRLYDIWDEIRYQVQGFRRWIKSIQEGEERNEVRYLSLAIVVFYIVCQWFVSWASVLRPWKCVKAERLKKKFPRSNRLRYAWRSERTFKEVVTAMDPELEGKL